VHAPKYTEQELLAAMAAGRRDAAEIVYRAHYPVVTKWIMANGGAEADAEDIFQEAMVVLFGKSRSEAFRLTCRIGTYLFAISKHLWFKRLRTLQRQPRSIHEGEELGESVYEDISAYQERELHYQQLQAALDQLGEPCSSLLKAFYHYDKSMQEIAADFGYTNPDNAKTQKYKCLTRLRKLFYGVQAR
jgi:RNA polymerase sigma factor (sigma-70 family)